MLAGAGGAMAVESGHGVGNVVKIELPIEAADYEDRLVPGEERMDLVPIPRNQRK